MSATDNGNRILNHPFLAIPESQMIRFTFDGQEMEGREGDTVAAALTANGIRVFRTTAKRNSPRGLYCGIGQCTDCVMIVNGRPNVRTCMTLLEENMIIQTQHGLGAADEEI